MNISSINKKLKKTFGGKFSASKENGSIFVRGKSSDWGEIVAACQAAAKKFSTTHIVNDIVYTGEQPAPTRLPSLKDDFLEGRTPDVLVIGGGISGASIARELTKWKLDVLLVDKEADLALQASGRNDGEVHPGIDLGKGSLKHKYIRRANHMYADVCRELDVPFKQVGQYVLFRNAALKPLIGLYAFWRKHHDGIEDTEIISGKELMRREPNLTPETKFAMYNPSAGCVCPYGLTIAYAENAVQNGAQVSLNTAVLSMEVSEHNIISVTTNRGVIHPKIVINAAGVFAEDIAAMADDRFFSIHPRRGTNSILDQKAGAYMHSVASVKDISVHGKTHSKGGGILHTVHDNLLVGPDAVETVEKENTETRAESIKTVFDKQTQTMPALSKRDIITYFTGVRAPTFEEDFILEPGRRTRNLIHVAGIQSPGLTTAPAVAVDMAELAVDMLGKTETVEKNNNYNPIRKGVPVLREIFKPVVLPALFRHGRSKSHCVPWYMPPQQISKGEILDALKSPICVPTVDGIKKRIRPGMGRCQGGFCSPLVTKIIAEFLGVPLYEVKKSSAEAVITYGETKVNEGGEE